MSTGSPPELSRQTARRLLLSAQGLGGALPRASIESVYATSERLGFVQVDSINVVERAHHLILGARLRGYRPALLTPLLEKQRRLFEHWTHDAAVIPTVWFRHWHHRFARFRIRSRQKGWWKERLGSRPERTLAAVRERLRLEGPLRIQAFAQRQKAASLEVGWWSWSREKSALEYLWLTGEVAIASRVNFHKVYDLTERVLPEAAAAPPSSAPEHEEWACRSALSSLGTATAEEIAAYFAALTAAEVRRWATRAVAQGEIAEVILGGDDGSRPRVGYAPLDWRERAAAWSASDRRIRLLCPFDPLLHDRKRTQRLFGFDYRFEAFVPAAKRLHGYYTMAVLEGDRLIGRFDPKLDRERANLLIRSLKWEEGLRSSRKRLAAFETAVGRLTRALGAASWSLD